MSVGAGPARGRGTTRRIAYRLAWVLLASPYGGHAAEAQLPGAELRKVKRLAMMLADPNLQVRQGAKRDLMAIGPRAIPVLIPYVGSTHSLIRQRVSEFLTRGEFQARHEAEIERRLIEALSSSRAGVRAGAAKLLGASGDQKLAVLLVKELARNEPPRREALLDLLSNIRRPEAIKALMAALTDKNPNLRSGAAYALGETEAHEAIELLQTALRDADEEVRRHAAVALAALEPDTAGVAEELVAALRSRYGYLRTKAYGALAQHIEVPALPALTEALADPDPSIRSTAIEVLGDRGDPAAGPALAKAMQETEPAMRRRAAQALADVSAWNAAPVLISALRDPDVGVRRVRAGEAAGRRSCRRSAGCGRAPGGGRPTLGRTRARQAGRPGGCHVRRRGAQV